MRFDALHFSSWCQNELPRGRRPETVKKTMERLQLLQRHGLDLDVFLGDPAVAEGHALDVLSRYAALGHPHHHRNLVKALNWVCQYAARPRGGDPAYRGLWFPLPWAPGNEPEGLMDEEVHRLLDYRGTKEADVRRRALVYVCIVIGCRKGEIADLCVSDLDQKRSAIHIGHPRKHGPVRLEPLPRSAWRKDGPLQEWLAVRPRPAAGPDWLWTMRWGGQVRRRLAHQLATKDLAHLGKRLGFQVSFTRFRHWRAQLIRRLGGRREVVSYSYGHGGDITPHYTGRVTWMEASTEYHRIGLTGYRAYKVHPPRWLLKVFG